MPRLDTGQRAAPVPRQRRERSLTVAGSLAEHGEATAQGFPRCQDFVGLSLWRHGASFSQMPVRDSMLSRQDGSRNIVSVMSLDIDILPSALGCRVEDGRCLA
jgi:hypothetical protein